MFLKRDKRKPVPAPDTHTHEEEKVWFCDKCGKEMNKKKDKKFETFIKDPAFADEDSINGVYMCVDLCSECQDDFLDLIVSWSKTGTIRETKDNGFIVGGNITFE